MILEKKFESQFWLSKAGCAQVRFILPWNKRKTKKCEADSKKVDSARLVKVFEPLQSDGQTNESAL